ncbi:pentapeptide repeat-containing protein [Haladaptatus cibarius]|uniref:pentapeptide repeat-containing protein n=1 Tax=Haladaptatus cibarius TaxID=453847 RepID=UPI0034A3714B
MSFEEAVFEADASFLAVQFYGRVNSIGDNTTFDEATFHGDVTFEYATFEYTSFEDVLFHGAAVFEKATVNGAFLLTDCTFSGVADFDEVTFHDDTSFRNAQFDAHATFRGVEFHGGAAVLADDVTFEDATFAGEVTFYQGTFHYSNFSNTAFQDDVNFERTQFDDDAVFDGATFDSVADFDEVLFNGDASFKGTTFKQKAIFRGGEFLGGTNYLHDDAIFTEAIFLDDADFHDGVFTSANFMDAKFEGSVDFINAEFNDSIKLRASSFGQNTYFNFTDAEVDDGEIIQPESGWIRFDFTKATLGTVTLRAENPDDERELLDYFRICDTTFEGFDFAAHTGYLDRNDWNLHTFDAGNHDYEFAADLTPEMTEKTYLKAKNSASTESNIKAAGEFRVKRQQFARKKFIDIATDASEGVKTRFKNFLRGVENWFLGVSCGYGLRLYRITTVFILFPLIAGFVFAFGGDPFATSGDQLSSIGALATSDGLHTLMINIYFSYITFLTIGYGGIGPTGIGARFTAAGLVYLNVILAGLFLYALIKRSEI